MNKKIDNLIATANGISDEVKDTFDGLSKEQLNIKPSSVDWSIGQCFDHLITTDSLYFPQFQKVADGTHVNNWFSAIPFMTSAIGGMLKKAVNPNSTKKMKAPALFEPSTSEISETIIDDFIENQSRFISLMKKVKSLKTSKIKIPTPISPAVNIGLEDAFEVIIMHERRHFNQAKRVLEFVENMK